MRKAVIVEVHRDRDPEETDQLVKLKRVDLAASSFSNPAPSAEPFHLRSPESGSHRPREQPTADQHSGQVLH
jgi:hypothetical protein